MIPLLLNSVDYVAALNSAVHLSNPQVISRVIDLSSYNSAEPLHISFDEFDSPDTQE